MAFSVYEESVRNSEDSTFAGSKENHSNKIIKSNLYHKLLKLRYRLYNCKHFENHLNDLTIVKKTNMSIVGYINDIADIFAVK